MRHYPALESLANDTSLSHNVFYLQGSVFQVSPGAELPSGRLSVVSRLANT